MLIFGPCVWAPCRFYKVVIVMLIQFLVGGIVSVCNITIHALVMTLVVRVARASGTKKRSHPSLRLIATMIATVSVLMAAHVLEVFVWSLAYSIADAAPAGTNLVYFAFVNYTTLGYGDFTAAEGYFARAMETSTSYASVAAKNLEQLKSEHPSAQ